MTNEYTPNTVDVRAAYAVAGQTQNLYDYDAAIVAGAPRFGPEFDRWLKAHDAALIARVVELEATLDEIRAEWNRGLETDFLDWEGLTPLLAKAPSVVLADHDAAVWDEGFVASETHKGVVAMAGQPWQVTTPANPYQGDNQNGDK